LGQLLIRNVPDDLKTALKRRAASRGVSMEAEARAILQQVVESADRKDPEYGLGTRIAALFKDCGFEEGEFQRIDEPVRFVDFEK
jgi:plasmid stability protein